MNTNAISSSYTNVLAQAGVSGVQRVNSRDSDGDKDGGKARGARDNDGHGVLNAVMQTLGQLGVNVPPPPTGQAKASTTQAQPANNGEIKQALHSFMNDLFQATRQSATPASAAPTPNSVGNPASGKAYGGLAPKLQGLMQQLNSGTSNEALTKLQASFDNLTKTVGNAANPSNSATTASTPKLQDFLQKLSQNLPGGGVSPLGSLVSTMA